MGDTAVMRRDIELMGIPQFPPLGKTLAIIFNEYITLGIFPDKLKCAKVIPIHKKVPPLIHLTTGLFHFFLFIVRF